MSSASETGVHTFRGVITLLILVLGLLSFVGGSVWVGWVGPFSAWQARLSGLQTEGMVTRLSGCDSGGEDVILPGLARGQIITNVVPTIQFTDQEHRHTYEVDNSFCGNYAVGELVTLWYAPSHPTTIFLEQDAVLWLILVIVDVLIMVGGLFLIGLVLYLFFGVKAETTDQQNGALSSGDASG